MRRERRRVSGLQATATQVWPERARSWREFDGAGSLTKINDLLLGELACGGAGAPDVIIGEGCDWSSMSWM
jgi:hypothetical protein